jgi:hypothetical protein
VRDEMGSAAGRTHAGRTHAGRTIRCRWVAGVAAAVLVVPGLLGCGGGDTPERTDAVDATPQASVSVSASAAARPSRTHADACAEARQARKSLDSLMRRDFSGVSGAQAAIVRLQSDLRDLEGAASGELKRQATVLSALVSELQKAVTRFQGGKGGADTWQAVRSSAEKVAASAGSMRRSLASACPER